MSPESKSEPKKKPESFDVLIGNLRSNYDSKVLLNKDICYIPPYINEEQVMFSESPEGTVKKTRAVIKAGSELFDIIDEIIIGGPKHENKTLIARRLPDQTTKVIGDIKKSARPFIIGWIHQGYLIGSDIDGMHCFIAQDPDGCIKFIDSNSSSGTEVFAPNLFTSDEVYKLKQENFRRKITDPIVNTASQSIINRTSLN